MMSDLPPPIPPPSSGYPPAPYSPFPAYLDPRKKDRDHLRLLSIFSYVAAGLAVLGIGFLFLNYLMMSSMMSNPEIFRTMSQNQPGPNPAIMFREMIGAFRWFYLVMGIWGAVMCVLNLLSGYYLGQRRHRTFCLIVAALNCIRLPLGTVLGIFSLIVLTRDSVRQLYAGENAASAPATGNNTL